MPDYFIVMANFLSFSFNPYIFPDLLFHTRIIRTCHLHFVDFSHVSAISLLGIPTEVFHYGSQYAACVITSILTAVITSYLFLPVFYKLQLTSTFEYLELRFTRPVRILSSVLFTISLFTYLPIVIYVPAIAFAQVSNLSVHAITPLLCIVCIIYTSIVSCSGLNIPKLN